MILRKDFHRVEAAKLFYGNNRIAYRAISFCPCFQAVARVELDFARPLRHYRRLTVIRSIGPHTRTSIGAVLERRNTRRSYGAFFRLGWSGGIRAGPAPGPSDGWGQDSSNNRPESSAAARHASPIDRLYSNRVSAIAR